MSKHLNVERWYYKTRTGAWRRKRVSAERELLFPLEYRKVYQTGNASGLVKFVMQQQSVSLAQAWETVKRMFNG